MLGKTIQMRHRHAVEQPTARESIYTIQMCRDRNNRVREGPEGGTPEERWSKKSEQKVLRSRENIVDPRIIIPNNLPYAIHWSQTLLYINSFNPHKSSLVN